MWGEILGKEKKKKKIGKQKDKEWEKEEIVNIK